VASNFIEFSGVTCPKLAWIKAAFWPEVKRPWSVAIPKYFFPFARNLTSILPEPPVLEPAVPVAAGTWIGFVARVVGTTTAVVVAGASGAEAVPGTHCE
jgi:hypothetical protein